MTFASNHRITVAACLLSLAAGVPVIAQDGEDAPFDRTPEDCILSSSIDQTDAVDDQNLLFYMRNRGVYRNTLPRECPGLERNNRFSYKLQGSRRLCSTDMITVLEDSFGGFSGPVPFREGFTCRLGAFVPLSPEEVEDLERSEDEDRGGRRTQSTIETSEVEAPSKETSDEPAAAEPAPAADESDD